MLLILAVQIRENSYILLIIHSEHMLTGSLKTVLLDRLWDAPISIVTFQGCMDYQNKFTL